MTVFAEEMRLQFAGSYVAYYGRERNVGVILWVVWKTLDDQLQPALDQFARWGVRGIKIDFMQRDDQPMSQGTRCHQLALFVVFESPLQMLADSPTHYRCEPEAMEFLAAVPTIWDETRVLDARIGEYVLLARRSGSDWFLGAITNWRPRDLDVDLSFLPACSYQLTQWSDGINTDRYAADFRRTTQPVSLATRLSIRLAPGGGWAARIVVSGN